MRRIHYVWLVLVALLAATTLEGAQAFSITCPGGVPKATPNGDALTIVCETFTPTPQPTATHTPVPTATATATPTVAPTATATPTATPRPTVAPTPTAVPVSVDGVLAFPGAEGFGAQAVGGRGGRVYLVTTLADSGAGSLRECVNASGPRTCVFRTGGTIELLTTLDVRNPYLTIAGQTAPGDGVQLKVANPLRSIDLFKISTYEVIVRYLKLRPGTQDQNARCLSINAGGSVPVSQVAHNIIIDHISCSWAGDEVLIAWDRTRYVSFTYNIFAESIGPGWKGPNLGKYGGGPYTMAHNLIAHHLFRLPNASGSGGTTETINNVIYNFQTFGMRATLGSMNNIIGNWIQAGPNTRAGATYVKNDLDVPDPDSPTPIPNPTTRGFYVQDNLLVPYRGTARITNLLPSTTKPADIKTQPYPASNVRVLTAQAAYDDVLQNAGAIHGLTCDGQWYRRPDMVDVRLVESVVNERDSRNVEPPQTGYIADPGVVGGWPQLSAGVPCADTDFDGMPDVWEQARGLNVGADDSAGDVDGDGWTNLEEYMNGVR